MKLRSCISFNLIGIGVLILSMFLTLGRPLMAITIPDSNYKKLIEIAKLKTIMVSNNYEDGKPKAIKYLIYNKTKFDPNQLTIIYLPGGPGGSFSKHMVKINEPPLNLKKVQHLYIDPRGTGLNISWGKKHPEKLSTIDTVNDVVEIIKTEGLKNYVLWGNSYGTVLATVLGHKIQELKLEKPKAVILEGTLGKSYEYSEFYFEGFELRIRDFLENIPKGLLNKILKFKSVANEEAYRKKIKEWVFDYEYSTSGETYSTLLNNIDYEIECKSNGSCGNEVEISMNAEDDDDDTFFRGYKYNTWIVCKEILSNKKNIPIKIDTRDELCAPTADSPYLYDSTNFQITDFPVIYIQGFQDLQTPYASAMYHYQNQKNKDKNSKFFTVFEHAHSVFKDDFHICQNDLIKNINDSDFTFKSFLTCAKKTNTRIKQYSLSSATAP